MRLLRSCAILLSSCTAVAAFGQTSAPVAPSAPGAIDLSSFHEEITQKHNTLSVEVSVEKESVKKNGQIIQDARKIDAANKRLEAQHRLLAAQQAEFTKQRDLIQAGETEMSGQPANPAPRPSPPQRVQQPIAPAPARVATVYTDAPPARPLPSRPTQVLVQPSPSTMPPAIVPQQAATVQPKPSPAPVAQQVARTPAPHLNDATEAPLIDNTVKTASVTAGPLPAPAAPALVRAAMTTPTEPMRISAGVSQGMLLTPIRPVYPSIALTAHIEGAVVVEALINKQGKVQSAKAISGPLMLRDAALEAVKEARYAPYRLNQEPIEVQTSVTIAFQRSH